MKSVLSSDLIALAIKRRMAHILLYFIGWPKKPFQDLETGLFNAITLKLCFFPVPHSGGQQSGHGAGSPGLTPRSVAHREKRMVDKREYTNVVLRQRIPSKYCT